MYLRSRLSFPAATILEVLSKKKGAKNKMKDKVVIVAGLPLDISGNTNILKVEVVGHRGRKANL